MRVSKERAEANRGALLQAASRLFREKGFDGVGVAEVANAAGLTHGALYAHFPSKEALAAAAFSHGFAGNMAGIRAWEGGGKRSFDDYLGVLLSKSMRERFATGCPLTASASEIGRQGAAVSENFAQAFEKMVSMVEASLNDVAPASLRRRLAVTSIAAEIGAVAVSRAVLKADKALADEVLESVRETISSAAKMKKPSSDKRGAVR
jgi:TetR/AcrR family transcriptional repressor of nem operon